MTPNFTFDRGRHYFQRAYDLNMAAGSLWGASSMLSGMSMYCLCPQGKAGEAFQTTQRAIDLAEESGDTYSRGRAYAAHGISCLNRGSLEEVVRHLTKGFEFADFMAFDLYGLALINLGQGYCEIGNFRGSQECYQKGISVLTGKEISPSIVALGRVLLSRAKAINGEKDLDLESIRLAPATNKIKSQESFILKCLGDIFLHVDRQYMAEAEQWFRKAIEASEKNGTGVYLGLAHASYAELFWQKGDRASAREQLGKATEILKECGSDGWVEKYEKELAKLS